MLTELPELTIEQMMDISSFLQIFQIRGVEKVILYGVRFEKYCYGLYEPNENETLAGPPGYDILVLLSNGSRWKHDEIRGRFNRYINSFPFRVSILVFETAVFNHHLDQGLGFGWLVNRRGLLIIDKGPKLVKAKPLDAPEQPSRCGLEDWCVQIMKYASGYLASSRFYHSSGNINLALEALFSAAIFMLKAAAGRHLGIREHIQDLTLLISLTYNYTDNIARIFDTKNPADFDMIEKLQYAGEKIRKGRMTKCTGYEIQQFIDRITFLEATIHALAKSHKTWIDCRAGYTGLMEWTMFQGMDK